MSHAATIAGLAQNQLNTDQADVIVVGGGNAGFTAAQAAARRGRKVMLLERALEDVAGGNSYYTAGATRVAHDGLDSIVDILDDDSRIGRTVLPPYSARDYAADLARVTNDRNDKAMTEVLVNESLESVRWLCSIGIRYRLMYERQAYKTEDGSYVFWGGLHIGNVDGGVGLIRDHSTAALSAGVDIRYGVDVADLLVEDGRVVGVRADVNGHPTQFRAESVILAAGGFEANPDWRREHLGPGWENAVVRGTPYNTGKLLEAALRIGAGRGGDWSTAHSVQWDAEARNNESNRILTNRLTRQSYPLGVIVNRDGRRFLDEGADFRNYTYAKYGKEILLQPGSIAFQIFDATLRPLLRSEEYDMPGVGVHVANDLGSLAESIGVPPQTFERTIADFNAGIDDSRVFDPTIKDGRCSQVDPPKSNWAMPILTAPFYAYPVTCGITFTFGGLKGDLDGRVLDERGDAIPGLFVCGEMLGGLFSSNYPGGSGLAAGIVFGRRAGSAA